MKQTSNNQYLNEIKTILQSAKDFAYSSVNSAMVQAYWLIGRRIVLEEQNGKNRAEYGKEIIKNVSVELTKDFGAGYSETNVRYFRQFYTFFPYEKIYHSLSDKFKLNDSQIITIHHAVSDELDENKKSHALSAKFKEDDKNIWHAPSAKSENNLLSYVFTRLSWTHIRHLLRVSDKKAQAYYIQETVKNNWSTRTLDRNIATQYYERLLLSQNEDLVKEEMQEKTKDFQLNSLEFIKNPAVLEFLNIPTNKAYTETEIEKSIVDNLQQFILELGKGFAFVERQKLIRTEKRDYFIDLVFYNYILKCFVLIDLKTERITHQDVGQMDMYVRMYDEKQRQETDNPTLGMVLCSETDSDIAKYSILAENKQIFATKYKLYLPTEEELRAEIERQKEIFKLRKF